MSEHQKWEHQAFMFRGDLIGCLNKAGQDGWEFCWIIEVVPGEDGKPIAHGCIMKRHAQLIVTDLTGAPPLKPRGE